MGAESPPPFKALPVPPGADVAVMPPVAIPASVHPISSVPEPMAVPVPMARAYLDHHCSCRSGSRGHGSRRTGAEEDGQARSNQNFHEEFPCEWK